MFQRTVAALAALIVGATALLPGTLVCRCLVSGARMAPLCCDTASRPPQPDPPSPGSTIAAACCSTEDPPALEARSTPAPRDGNLGAPLVHAVALAPLPPAAGPIPAGSPSPALARGSPHPIPLHLLTRVLRI